MIVSGEITIPAPRAAVFDALQNAPFFASCVEGVRDLKEIDATHYDAVLETKVAYMKFSFKVSVEVTKIAPPDRIEAKIEGTPIGMVGRFTAVSTTDLTEAGDETRGEVFDRRQHHRQARQHGPAGAQSEGQGDGKELRREDARGVRGGRARSGRPAAGARSCRMIPFELAEPATLQEALQPARSRRRLGASARRRHRADADDEGRRVPADAASSACARSPRSSASPSAPTAASSIGALTPLVRRRALRRGGASAPASSCAPCGGSPTCGCATSRPSAAISPMAIPTWTCRRC